MLFNVFYIEFCISYKKFIQLLLFTLQLVPPISILQQELPKLVVILLKQVAIRQVVVLVVVLIASLVYFQQVALLQQDHSPVLQVLLPVVRRIIIISLFYQSHNLPIAIVLVIISLILLFLDILLQDLQDFCSQHVELLRLLPQFNTH